MVIFSPEQDGSDGNGFLADIEVEESSHLALVVKFESRLLEAADAQHLGQETDFLFRAELRVNLSFGVVHCGGFGFFYGHTHE